MSKISLIRHWDAKYENTASHKSFDWATDIKEWSIEKLKNQATEFTKKLKKDEQITIWSSPIPRAIETANIFTDEIKKNWFNIRTRKIFEIFEEVKWFKWDYLQKMVDWWELIIDWVSYSIDKNKTNPKGLTYWQYFRNSSYKKIDPVYISSIWKAWEILSWIESYESMFKRIFREISRLTKLKTSKNHILIFTHQCNTDFLVELLNDYKNWWIQTGEHITLSKTWIDFDVIDFPQEQTNWNATKIVENSRKRFQDLLI